MCRQSWNHQFRQSEDQLLKPLWAFAGAPGSLSHRAGIWTGSLVTTPLRQSAKPLSSGGSASLPLPLPLPLPPLGMRQHEPWRLDRRQSTKHFIWNCRCLPSPDRAGNEWENLWLFLLSSFSCLCSGMWRCPWAEEMAAGLRTSCAHALSSPQGRAGLD